MFANNNQFSQVENLVGIELAYVNTKHPDFTEASLIHRTFTESLDGDFRKQNNPISGAGATKPPISKPIIQAPDSNVSADLKKEKVCIKKI